MRILFDFDSWFEYEWEVSQAESQRLLSATAKDNQGEIIAPLYKPNLLVKASRKFIIHEFNGEHLHDAFCSYFQNRNVFLNAFGRDYRIERRNYSTYGCSFEYNNFMFAMTEFMNTFRMSKDNWELIFKDLSDFTYLIPILIVVSYCAQSKIKWQPYEEYRKTQAEERKVNGSSNVEYRGY
jgi:hypothetical protein